MHRHLPQKGNQVELELEGEGQTIPTLNGLFSLKAAPESLGSVSGHVKKLVE